MKESGNKKKKYGHQTAAIPRVVMIAVLFCMATLPLAAEYFVIDHYGIEIDVMENNSYTIVETIDVTFSEERHGIYRTIPLEFDGQPVKLKNISVPGYESKVDRSSEEATIRVGSADKWVDGEVSYTISYTYDVGADSLPDMDEFNQNLIGPEWGTDILAADFRITMPKSFDASKLNFTSGDYGSTDNNGVEWNVSGNVITGRLLKPLSSYQGLTAALPLPEGYWVGAEKHRAPGSLFYSIFGYPFYALCILGAFLLWYAKGRDNQLFPSVEFQPPEGMNPSEIGYIIDGSVDQEDVTSLILYWADQGCLEIEEEKIDRVLLKDKKILHLIKVKELPSSAEDYEEVLFRKLFNTYGDGERVSTEDLTNTFYTEVSTAQVSITKSFTDNPDRAIYYKQNRKFTALTALMAALPIIFAMMEGFSKGMSGSGFPPILAIPFSLFLIIPSLILGSAFTDKTGKAKAKIIMSLLFGGFSFLFFAVFLVASGGLPLLKYVAAVASGITVGIFVSIMSRRTEYGDRMLEKTLGFKEFIKEAETDKLETLFESNPSYFYDILPYAMVLNLTDKWAAHFDSIAMEPPNWYRGYGHGRFSTVVFASTMQGSFNTINTSMTSAPSSSGSSGSSSSGGFSGGGSGGGGGGSW